MKYLKPKKIRKNANIDYDIVHPSTCPFLGEKLHSISLIHKDPAVAFVLTSLNNGKILG